MPDGTIVNVNPNVQNTCQHNAAFFLNPDYETILSTQQFEINLRRQQYQNSLQVQQQGLQPDANG